MVEFLELFPFPGEATFFCTEAYPCLERKLHELAPHPYLGKSKVWLAELNRMRSAFPRATGWRSHSCVFSHIIAEWLAFNGYLYASTFECFGRDGTVPIRNDFGIWQMPIYYMDNLDISRGRFWPKLKQRPFDRGLIDVAIDGKACYIFDFHPIHLLLNSPEPEWYFERREAFKQGTSLTDLRFDGYGAASFFGDLASAMSDRGVRSYSMLDALLKFEPAASLLDAIGLEYTFDNRKIDL